MTVKTIQQSDKNYLKNTAHKRNNSYHTKSNNLNEKINMGISVEHNVQNNSNSANYSNIPSETFHEGKTNEDDAVVACIKNFMDIITKISEDFETFGKNNATNLEEVIRAPYKKPNKEKKNSLKLKKENFISMNNNNDINNINHITLQKKFYKYVSVPYQNIEESEKSQITKSIIDYSEVRMKNYKNLVTTINYSFSDIKDLLNQIRISENPNRKISFDNDTLHNCCYGEIDKISEFEVIEHQLCNDDFNNF